MKYLILSLLVTMLFFGCTEENIQQKESSIYGTWQLIEVLSGAPTVDGWNEIADGYTYKIRGDARFETNISTECQSGMVSITDAEITFEYDCEGFTMNKKNPEGVFKYSYTLGSILELKPININCYEGCAYRFKKIEEDKPKAV
jgi:hypothetical protein